MSFFYLAMVVLLFMLAAFDLWVGVSNDAVNFLNSAIGSRAARFRTIVCVAAVGVFLGASLSNGMMDIARHGIFNPALFSFREVIIIFLAVMVTDIVLLDVFNTFGMPTSTTVSMVFELLGAAFAFTLIKMAGGDMLGLGDYLNTAKALEVILGIFLSVPIAFCVGTFAQWLARILFTFDLCKGVRWKIGLFGGGALTAIIYFMLFKGMKDLSFMSADVKDFVANNVGVLLGVCFVVLTCLMQLLHALRVNVLRVVVLTGTFALSMAFAGNDLVNFIGVPLAGFSAYQDFAASGAADAEAYHMLSLQESAATPIFFLLAAGAIMVLSLATSRKARGVVKTEVGLSSRDQGDEMFGSSKAARSIVRWASSVAGFVVHCTPASVRRFVNKRFVPVVAVADDGAAYDLLRASVNLCVASLLIALGTSLKLPLSTTFVTFMVAMGASLADRAWTRGSAVFRITGVLTVIGGWFITAGVAFSACFMVAMAMRFGGYAAIGVIVAGAVLTLIHSQRRYARKQNEVMQGDTLFLEIMSCRDSVEVVPMLGRHLGVSVAEKLEQYATELEDTTDALFNERLRKLRHSGRTLVAAKRILKNLRRRETLCLRRAEPAVAVKLSTTFHLIHNSMNQILYGLLRINEPAVEQVDNNFAPPVGEGVERFCNLRGRLVCLMRKVADDLRNGRLDRLEPLRGECGALRADFSALRHAVLVDLQRPDADIAVATLFLHVIQETEQIDVELRDMIGNLRRFYELS